jgi:triosephosphate isomerase (TIM)
MRKIIIGNWKMNPHSAKEAVSLARQVVAGSRRFGTVEVVLAPPFVFIPLMPRSSKVAVGAQNLFWEKEGSFTGEVSASMLKSVGIKYVILGHSERRVHLNESEEQINAKLKIALTVGIKPILCVGEKSRDPEGKFFSVIKKQIISALSKIKKGDIARIVIAYEPVWAISSKKSSQAATPEDAGEAAMFIRKTIAALYGVKIAKKVSIIYGGSTNPKNAPAFLKQRDISGLLVGRESRSAKDFIRMIECARTNL